MSIAAYYNEDEFDGEEVISVLVDHGWHLVVLTSLSISEEFYGWIEQNIKGEFEQYNMTFVFKDAQDANWFKLRWL